MTLEALDVHIGSKYQVLIPRVVREALGLEPGDTLLFVVDARKSHCAASRPASPQRFEVSTANSGGGFRMYGLRSSAANGDRGVSRRCPSGRPIAPRHAGFLLSPGKSSALIPIWLRPCWRWLNRERRSHDDHNYFGRNPDFARGRQAMMMLCWSMSFLDPLPQSDHRPARQRARPRNGARSWSSAPAHARRCAGRRRPFVHGSAIVTNDRGWRGRFDLPRVLLLNDFVE